MTNEERRNRHAENVCRELRYQIVKYGKIGEPDKMMKHLARWMRFAKKIKYARP